MATFRVTIPNVTIDPSPKNSGVYLRHFIHNGYIKRVRFDPQEVYLEAKCYPVNPDGQGQPEHDYFIEVANIHDDVDFNKNDQKATLVVTDEKNKKVIGTVDLGKPQDRSL